MARTARIKHTGEGVAFYHLMSRTNNKRFLFEKGKVKTALVDALKRSAEFSGVGIKAYVAMDNHFHVIVRVERTNQPVPEEELIRRVGILKGRRAADELAEHWKNLRCAGLEADVLAAQDRLRVRMNDISAFMKTFKETFDRIYRKDHAYCGSIWSGRFVSTLIEDGRYLAICKRYVIYNPIRAGLVTQAKDYPWAWNEDNAAECATSDVILQASAGPVPAEVGMRRVVQIGAGKVFGSAAFVRETTLALGAAFRAKHTAAHPVVTRTGGKGKNAHSMEAMGELACSTHGWKLARAKVA